MPARPDHRAVAVLFAATLGAPMPAQNADKRYALETSMAPRAWALREAMRQLAAGLAVPATPAIDTVAEGRTTWRASADDEAAIRCFRECDRRGRAGSQALIALAATTPSVQVARRALLCATFADHDAERHTPLLLRALDHDDPIVRTFALELLGRAAGQELPPTLRKDIVDRMLERWPSDPRAFPWERPRECRRGDDGAWRSASPTQLVTASVAIAASTGDPSVIASLVALWDPQLHPTRCQAFVLTCLHHAAANVDAPTARRIHTLVLPLMTPRDRPDHSAWAKQILVLMFAQIPDDLLPTLEPLLRDDVYNAWLRNIARSGRRVPDDRLRLLLRPLDREHDRELMLCAPDLVVSALRNGGQDRQRMIDILDGTAERRQQPSPPPCGTPGGPRRGLSPDTAMHWRAVLPAIEALPPSTRHALLSALMHELMQCGIDAKPLVEAAQVEVLRHEDR